MDAIYYQLAKYIHSFMEGSTMDAIYYQLAKMSGQMQSWSDELERIKRNLEPEYLTGTLTQQLDWSALDHIICKMRESVTEADNAVKEANQS